MSSSSAKVKAASSSSKSRSEQTKNKVLEVAIKEFSERTYREVQASEIAKKAGVAHGIVFHYFKNKRGLYVESVQAMAAKLFDLKRPDPNLAPYFRVREQLGAMIDRMVEHDDIFLGYVKNTMAIEADPIGAKEVGKYETRLGRWFCELCELSEHEEIVIHFIHIIHSSMDKIFADWIMKGCPQPKAAVVETAIQIVVGALRGAANFEPSLDVERAVKLLLEKPQD